jgi:phospholipid/cholesterol/gamma-HCH transport system substrate-binding protein
MKPISERNPVTIGVAGVLVLVLAVAVTYFSDDLPIIGGGTTYTAKFTEVAGLRPTNEVRVSGVRVGKVTGIELDGDEVAVEFRVDDLFIGDTSTASIEIKTLLGQKYLALRPKGTRPLDPHTAIPAQRTQTPFEITGALEKLGKTVDEIDTEQLASSFGTIADTFGDTGPHVRGTLNGLSKLSKTIAGRDRELGTLLGNTKTITGTLAARDKQLRKLIGDGNLLLGELQSRKKALDRLLTGVRELAVEIDGVIADNRGRLQPALRKLERVATVLERNQANLSEGLKNLAPYYRVFANTLGNGRWFDAYVCGLLPPSVDLHLLNFNSGGCKPPRTHTGSGGGR